ncbi:plasmolipin-like [Apostichopus japonicus]|uniref:plasmolipin-like n=1 Tax=Stichopus japonicus TaxID=307972 RepID=UPI003AB7A2AE
MADGDFPDSYETKTTTTTTSSTTVCTYNVAYIQTLDGMLRIAEIVVGLIYWICVAAAGWYPGGGFVLSATIIIWIFTIIIFCLYLFMIVERITIINWPLSEFISNIIWAICHFIGIIRLLVTVTKYARYLPFGFWVSFICSFGITFLYAFHAFLGFKRGVVSFRSETSGATVQT